jgi:polysaccharide pyruvyl transferase WcaK-like protein
MKDKKKVLYPTRIEIGNLGDILINALLIRELLKNKQVFLKGKPEQDFYDLISLNNPNISNLIVVDEIDTKKSFVWFKYQTFVFLLKKNRFHFVFDTPGHISGKKSWILDLLKIFFEIVKILIYKIFQVKYVKYGITLGPFSEFSWKFYQYICRLSYKVVVRDQQNFTSLRKKNFKNISVKPDLAYLLFKDSQLIGDIHQKSLTCNGVITISLRGSTIGKNIDQDYLRQISTETCQLIHQLYLEKNITKINIVYQVDVDLECCQSLLESLKINFPNLNINFNKEILGFESALNFYKNSEIVITNRLHVFLFSMSVKTKTYVVTDIQNHTKLVAVISDLHLSNLIYSRDIKVNWVFSEFELFAQNATNNKLLLEEDIKQL